jgi:glycosyltransferase involved in cell wall biosynthesis
VKFFLFCYWHDEYSGELSGGFTKIRDLLENLCKHRHTAFLFIPKIKLSREQRAYKIIEIPTLNIRYLRAIFYYLISFIVSFIFCCKEKPDIIYMRMMSSPLNLVLARLRRIPVIVEINDDPFINHNSIKELPLKLKISAIFHGINFRGCNKIHVITDGLRDKILRFYKIPIEKIEVIPSGANTSLFRPMLQKQCQEYLNLQTDKKYIGFVGTLLKRQGVDTLINSAPEIISKNNKVRFLIVGEGAMKNAWIEKVQQTEYSEYFIFTGQVLYTEAPKYINAMDICVAPFIAERGETSPAKIFDYFSCGKPVVASDIPSVRRFFEESGAVLFTPPDNPDSLACNILRLLDDENLSKTMGERGRNFVTKNYDREIVAKKIIEMSQKLIKGF